MTNFLPQMNQCDVIFDFVLLISMPGGTDSWLRLDMPRLARHMKIKNPQVHFISRKIFLIENESKTPIERHYQKYFFMIKWT